MSHSKNNSDQCLKPLTVLQVLPKLQVGGVERGTIEFAVYLKQQGHHPIVVSHGGPLVEKLRQQGILHIRLNVEKKSIKTLFSVKQLRKIIKFHQVDVVHARSRIPAWIGYFALAKLNPRPVFVTTLHGLHSVSKYSSVMARGDQVIAVSQAAKNYLLQHFSKYLVKDPVVIYRGVSKQFVHGHQADKNWLLNMNNQFPGFDTYKKVLLPGRLTAVKGFENIMPWLKTAPVDCRLLLTAEPKESNYSQKIQQLLIENKLEDKVLWLGITRKIADLYAAVDVVVSVNKKPESFGRTVLEALTVGTPVVAIDQGGVSEIMHQLFPEGLVPIDDSAKLADKINQFIQLAPEVKPHNNFKNTTMFESTIALYQQHLSTQ
jgi:glycosyltransferase involved in cell wall biosynthesis